MQNNAQSLLLIHRENYNVPKGQERSVHCKVAKADERGNLTENPQIKHFKVKAFETYLKENLEKMGYLVEILYHPLGKYSNVVIRNAVAEKDAEIERLKAELASKGDAEIEKIKAEKDKEIADKDAELARIKAETEAEIAKVRKENEDELKRLRAEIVKAKEGKKDVK